MKMGEVEHFQGRVVIDGIYGFIWSISQIDEEIIQILTNRENKANPEPIRPILGCDDCNLLKQFKEQVRLAKPSGGFMGKNPGFVKDWKQDRLERSVSEKGLDFKSKSHGVTRGEDSESLMVKGFCPALNGRYRAEVAGKANCAENI